MAFGIEIINTGGDLQISEAYSNFQLIAGGTGSATADTVAVPYSYPSQTSGIYPLVFVRPHNDGDFVGGCYFGGTWLGGTANSVYITATGAFDYRIYGLNGGSLIDSSTFGLQVFDTGGNVNFDSRKSGAQVQTLVTATTIWPNNTAPQAPFDNPTIPITKSFTSFGIRPWFMVNNLVNYAVYGGNGIWACAIDPSANTSSIIFSNGWQVHLTGAWDPNTTNGSNGWYTQGFAGGQCVVPLAICY